MIVAPKDVHTPIPGTCGYVTIYDKWNFADMIKYRLGDGDSILGYLVGPN